MDIARISEQNALESLQKFDSKKLARTSELGTNYNFEKVVPIATEIISRSNEIDKTLVKTFPQTNQDEINSTCIRIYKYFNSIMAFDISSNNSIHRRDTLINQAETNLREIFNLVLKYKSMMPVQHQKTNEIKDYKIQLKNAVNSAQSDAKQIKEILYNKSRDLDDAAKIENNLTDKFHAKVHATDTKIKELESDTLDNYNQLSAKLEKNFSNLKAELKEALSLDEARTLWDTKRKSHRTNYYVLGVMILAMLIGVPIFVFLNVEFITSNLSIINNLIVSEPFIEDTNNTWVFALSNQITKLLIIGLPITAYIWTTRIIVRIFLANRALMDDAYERKTMLDTYLYLVGQGNANKEDRPLILNALFRSSPGQAPDIEPPNLSDVVNLKRQSD